MTRDSWQKSLEAHHAYYARVFDPPVSEQDRRQIERKTILIEHYRKAIDVRKRLEAIEALFGYKYSPSQPRVPAGSSNGGQWTAGDGASAGSQLPSRCLIEDTPADPPGTQYADSGQSMSDAREAVSSSDVLDDPDSYLSGSYPNEKRNTECVAFAQQVGGAPLTSHWITKSHQGIMGVLAMIPLGTAFSNGNK